MESLVEKKSWVRCEYGRVKSQTEGKFLPEDSLNETTSLAKKNKWFAPAIQEEPALPAVVLMIRCRTLMVLERQAQELSRLRNSAHTLRSDSWYVLMTTSISSDHTSLACLPLKKGRECRAVSWCVVSWC